MRLKSSRLQIVFPWGRIIHPLLTLQFGLEDDGTSLHVAQQWICGKFDIIPGPDLGSGRFSLFHRARPSLIDLLGGKNPTWHYLSNALGLILPFSNLIYFERARGTIKPQAGNASRRSPELKRPHTAKSATCFSGPPIDG